MENEIMTIEDVARLLKVSERTIYDWAQHGKIPGGKLGTSWRFKRDEIEKWISDKLTPRIDTTKMLPRGIKTILTPDRCIVSNAAGKDQILNKLIDAFSGFPGIRSRNELAEAIFNREKLMSTGIGLGIAVPHVRLSNVKDIGAAIGLNKTPIQDYESLDGLPVQIVIMIVAGRNQHSEYLQILSTFATFLKDEKTRSNVLSCNTGAEVYALLGASL
jgi:PTS system nitrogen regulatory IIA component